MFGSKGVKRNINRLEGSVHIDIDQDLEGWSIYAYIGPKIVLSDQVDTEAEAKTIADKFEAELLVKGFA